MISAILFLYLSLFSPSEILIFYMFDISCNIAPYVSELLVFSQVFIVFFILHNFKIEEGVQFPYSFMIFGEYHPQGLLNQYEAAMEVVNILSWREWPEITLYNSISLCLFLAWRRLWIFWMPPMKVKFRELRRVWTSWWVA